MTNRPLAVLLISVLALAAVVACAAGAALGWLDAEAQEPPATEVVRIVCDETWFYVAGDVSQTYVYFVYTGCPETDPAYWLGLCYTGVEPVSAYQTPADPTWMIPKYQDQGAFVRRYMSVHLANYGGPLDLHVWTQGHCDSLTWLPAVVAQ